MDLGLGANVCVAYVAETGEDETAADANWGMDVIVYVSVQDEGEIGMAIAYGYGEDETGVEDEEQTMGVMLEMVMKTGMQTHLIWRGNHYAAVAMEWLQHYKIVCIWNSHTDHTYEHCRGLGGVVDLEFGCFPCFEDIGFGLNVPLE